MRRRTSRVCNGSGPDDSIPSCHSSTPASAPGASICIATSAIVTSKLRGERGKCNYAVGPWHGSTERRSTTAWRATWVTACVTENPSTSRSHAFRGMHALVVAHSRVTPPGLPGKSKFKRIGRADFRRHHFLQSVVKFSCREGTFITTTMSAASTRGVVFAKVPPLARSTSHARAARAKTVFAMSSISSYLPADTYNSLEKDGDLTFLHTMLRVDDLDATMAFFSALGLQETRRKESDTGKFTLVFMASAPGAPEIELTHNWGGETFAKPSRSMGHLAYATDDIYALCQKLHDGGITINRPPRDGKMAFVKSPDGISVELLQKGAPLPPAEPWASAENVGEW